MYSAFKQKPLYMTKKKALVLTAPSGAGKGTFMKYTQGLGFKSVFSVSCTTRVPRAGEVDGKDYYFISIEEFKERIARGEFLEWQEVYPGGFYGTLRAEVERIAGFGGIALFDVDVLGAKNIKRELGDEALAIFIKAPSVEALRNRLIERNSESEEKRNERLQKAPYEMQFENDFDEVLVNDDLEVAKKDYVSILQKHNILEKEIVE